MTDYSQLVKRLRDNALLDECEGCNPDVVALEREAADAIDALQADRDQANTALVADEGLCAKLILERDALQARVAEFEKLAQRISDEGRIVSGGIRRPAKYIQIPADLFSLARALLERKA